MVCTRKKRGDKHKLYESKCLENKLWSNIAWLSINKKNQSKINLDL